MTTTTEIPLSRGLVAIVDAEDAPLVAAYRWSATPAGRTFYAARSIRRADGTSTTQRMHQLLTGYATTDHLNGDGLDNRRANLREATQCQNLCNQRRRISSQGLKGATFWKRDGTWKAQIGLNGKNYHLGYFATEEEAARAYDKAARVMHGEFATLNFPQPGERAA